MIGYRNILVTGGTGFFASAYIKKKLDQTDVERICVYSRSESRQAELRQKLGNPDRLRWFIGDVRDLERLRVAMDGVDLVVHTAALKRIEAVEYNVLEAVGTNIFGTENVCKAAIDTGVKRVIFLSSDKACNPTTIYGMTKAIGEQIVQKAHLLNEHAPRRPWNWRTTFAVCRYGNVMGSTGSVVPTWRAIQKAGGDTVPVSDPYCTRFWMGVDDAIDLVNIAALTDSPDNEVILPHHLRAFMIGNLAAAMRLTMEVTGLADREKLHEEMQPGETSDNAIRMTVEDIRKGLADLGI